MQQLAEICSRSGKRPVFLVGLLHQGFSAYADQLSQSAQREWEKVAARFDEIIFNQPLDQISTLIAAAIHIKSESVPHAIRSELRKSSKEAFSSGWFGVSASSVMETCSQKIYPLHPTILPVLVRVFNRFGQNERSLFSFLLSNEPFGLQDFSHKHKISENQHYRIYDLYDYVKFNFGHRLIHQSYRSHWNQIDSMIDSFIANSDLEIKILKTIGLLNLINSNDLLATEQLVTLAVAGSDQCVRKQVQQSILNLQKVKRVIYNRGVAGGLCLWPHTSVDIEQAYENSAKAVGSITNVAQYIKDNIHQRPIVARKHYIETGNLRFFNVHYVGVSDLCKESVEKIVGADGHILVILCENNEDMLFAKKFVLSQFLKDHQDIVIAITPILNNMCSLIQEARQWQWVSLNTLELNRDRYAAEEVTRQVAASQLVLNRELQRRIGLQQLENQIHLEFYWKAKQLCITNGKQLLSQLSVICDRMYSHSPLVKNELINRSFLSTAAAAARMRLIERMIEKSDVELLGMDPNKKPPEMSIYLSLLKNTKIHRKVNSAWKLCEPKDDNSQCRLSPVFNKIHEVLTEKVDARVKITELAETLRRAPYGMRDGLFPLVLTIYLICHQHEIALYENGTFVRKMASEEILRLTKKPESFELQLCKIVGIRITLFEKILSMLKVNAGQNTRSQFLEIVRSLCGFVAKLPEYSRHTIKLDKKSIAVRNAILNAKDPAKLLFVDLPVACGHEPFKMDQNTSNKSAETFVIDLRSSIDELKFAYTKLSERIKCKIIAEFNFDQRLHGSRDEIAKRCEKVLIQIKESNLKAFCMRMMDEQLPEPEWIESVGSLVASVPPSRWRDADEDRFAQEIESLIRSFKRVEAISFSASPTGESSAIRLSITKSDGTEQEQVFHFSPAEEKTLSQLKTEFSHLFRKNTRLALIAASQAIWHEMGKKELN